MNETLVYPGTLAQALNYSGSIKAGDRLLLKTGVYSGDYVSTLEGTAEKPVWIMPYPGDSPVIDGSLTINGKYTNWMDLELTFSGWTTRQTLYAGSIPPDLPISKILEITQGTGCKVINCTIHDLAGVHVGTDVELYGNVISRIGWLGPDRGHGHGLYAQNSSAGWQNIKHNSVLDTFGYGIHAYAEGGTLHNYDVVENTLFNAGNQASSQYNDILIGGLVTPDDIHLIGNLCYGRGIRLGYAENGATHVTFQDNYAPGGFSESGVVQYDLNSGNYVDAAIGDQTFLHANAYNANRANLTIYNQAQVNTVTVDVSSLWASGTVKARNVQNYFSDIQTLTITGGNMTVNMQAVNRTVAAPVQWTAPATTFPAFGAFVLEKQ